jgi:hypothetical protein
MGLVLSTVPARRGRWCVNHCAFYALQPPAWHAQNKMWTQFPLPTLASSSYSYSKASLLVRATQVHIRKTVEGIGFCAPAEELVLMNVPVVETLLVWRMWLLQERISYGRG